LKKYYPKYLIISIISFLLLTMVLLLSFPVASRTVMLKYGNEHVIASKQNRWVKKTSRQLKKIKPEDCTQPIEPRIVNFDGHFLISYRVDSNSGCIQLPNGDWIYMITHSIHDDPAIGDITLAIDNRQRLFFNTGHVCGGIINFYIDTEKEINSAQDFFNSFLSDCDDCKWKEKIF
jgi:hypothetical protein